jgi:hypothetical protein
MWEPSEWIALGALIVAAISAVAAIVSVGYTWWDRAKARPESYRAALYERQLSAVEQFVAIVRRFHDEVSEVERSAERLDTARRELTAFVGGSVFIPPEVVTAANTWLREVMGALEAEAERGGTTIGEDARTEPSAELVRQLDAVWRRFVRRVWLQKGADVLHGQVRELTGAAAIERQRRDAFARIRRLDMELDVISRGRYQAPSDEELWRELEDRDLDRDKPKPR